MYLSDTDIEKEVKKGNIVLKPFDTKRLNPASYDITLGNTFLITEWHKHAIIDPAKKILPATREVFVKNGEEFVLHPGVVVLGFSQDFFGSDNYLIHLGGKSSLARIGLLVHNTAGIINPGHFLNIVFELSNTNVVPIVLRPGMPIAQITFSPLSSAPKHSYTQVGRYAGNNNRGYVPPKKNKKR
jgi:dCTP deaminase